MFETILLDTKTIIIKAEQESDLDDVIEFITQKGKRKAIDEFLKFASENRVLEKDFKFNRDDCYDR